ncbi:tRNA (adenosine(37)-N6)-threonylcarbamoyltransferase complex dimerization subunit type 1 TsaB [candidate division LCP-89 bacterium B3_LCP]|uniref:tRNA (Adenosine(37)-N6)-threonylcarbamoyltransferase complex dimerization subunit type 1 TsaB n=1 Tax=candidate division LCP-89 bacterium B3_LCP TaxID=2012998 RepID=A0A532UUE0_UNCL8|nr:MAG: tRNA (adenosine(37)-N6)-threonylcarbamoyltransferase complex dimerization subunit type 1 TsaB [candidate division LCP-89 bacterium B3_LCP]
MILAIDTSGTDCGAALWEDSLIDSIIIAGALRHNEVLLKLIDRVLYNNEVKPSDISVVAVSSGPGSFTGLRVGMAVAKGLCLSWSLPLVAVPTLEGLANCVPFSAGNAMTLMPARATEVYWALFHAEKSEWVSKSSDTVSDIADLAKVCQRDLFLYGEGYTKHQDVLDRLFLNRRVTLPETESLLPLAVATAKLAADRFLKGQIDDVMNSEPNYCYSFPRKDS